MNETSVSLRVASFFSGIGGFDLAFERAGCQVVFQCERDKFCQKVLHKHWPHVNCANDINTLTAQDIPDAQIWCGGFPCQDLSLANQGKRQGLEGKRSGLFTKFAELASTARPKWLLRMSLGYLTVETGKISSMSSKHWMTSGISWRGEYWTRSTSEHPKDAVVSSLSQVIKATAPRECFLTTEYLEKWLERAQHRSTPLPSSLDAAFKSQISFLSNTPPLEENILLDHKPRDGVTTAKHTHSIPEVAPTLFVRRMMASEYEQLQGFPENWTLVD